MRLLTAVQKMSWRIIFVSSLDPVQKNNPENIRGYFYKIVIYFLMASAIVFPISAGLATT